MKTESQYFESAKEMVNWLIDNEGKQLADGFGRKWMYENYLFHFKDIGAFYVFEEETVSCLHLFSTVIKP